MAFRYPWLATLKANQLKRLALETGINVGGTKPELTSRISTHLTDTYHDPAYQTLLKARDSGAHLTGQSAVERADGVISIDMGLRNFAYCHFNLGRTGDTALGCYVNTWTRMAIVGGRKTIQGKDANEVTEPETSKEGYDPATYARYAYKLVTFLLERYKPQHILIERQRFRTGSFMAVQEWTLRVNMFEGMLYAILESLSQRGEWAGNVYAISPARVMSFWDDKAHVLKSKRLSTKNVKIDLAAEWLLSSEKSTKVNFAPSSNAEETRLAFISKRKGGKNVRINQQDLESGQSLEVEIGKLDDLADCLLQGMAWLQWLENTAKIVDGGLEAWSELSSNRAAAKN